MSYDQWIRHVYGEDPEKYLPSDSLKLTAEQKALIMMRVTYCHFANQEGFWIRDRELQKVLDELEF